MSSNDSPFSPLPLGLASTNDLTQTPVHELYSLVSQSGRLLFFKRFTREQIKILFRLLHAQVPNSNRDATTDVSNSVNYLLRVIKPTVSDLLAFENSMNKSMKPYYDKWLKLLQDLVLLGQIGEECCEPKKLKDSVKEGFEKLTDCIKNEKIKFFSSNHWGSLSKLHKDAIENFFDKLYLEAEKYAKELERLFDSWQGVYKYFTNKEKYSKWMQSTESFFNSAPITSVQSALTDSDKKQEAYKEGLGTAAVDFMFAFKCNQSSKSTPPTKFWKEVGRNLSSNAKLSPDDAHVALAALAALDWLVYDFGEHPLGHERISKWKSSSNAPDEA